MDAYIYDANGVPEKLWNGKRIQDFTLEDKLKFIIETDVSTSGSISEETAELLKEEGYIYKNDSLINKKSVVEIEAAEKLKLLEVFVKNDIGLYGTVQKNTLKSIQNQGYTVIDGHIIKEEQTHLETPVNIAQENLKSTLVINAFGGPGAGKSTACLDIVSALKKRGFVAEYVSEYAKELVWQNRLNLLDGTEAHQRMILQEQYNRVERLIGKCDIIVTDSPLLLNMNYNKELTPAYEEEVKQLYDKFTNFAFVVERDRNKFEQEGRIHNLEESEALDQNITDMLDKYQVKYGTYNHATIDKVVYNAAKVYYGILNAGKSIDQKPEVKEAAKYNKEKYLQQQEEKLAKVNLQIKEMSINYETHPEQIAELLAFSSKFYNYSARNILLIQNQNPHATFVQSFDQWKEAGYTVKKGQQGLKVLVPVKTTYLEVTGENKLVKLSDATPEQQRLYKTHQIDSVQKTYYSIGNVFDISQTSCPVSEYPQYYSMGYKDADQDRIIEGIENYCKDSLKMPVNTSDLSSIGLRGYYDDTAKAITLNELLESTEKLSTLTHELGHAVMDHTAFTEVSNRSQQEFEADCFSVMLDNHLGIDVTEARKRHLADNYSKMEKNYLDRDANYDFDKIISDVFSRYKKVIVDMDVYINNQIEADKKKEECLEDSLIEDIGIDESLDAAGTALFDKMVEKSYPADIDFNALSQLEPA